jgi:hypothetical protein
MHKISEFALPAALILAGVGGLGWVATSTHARVEPRPSAAGSALEHQLHCAPRMLHGSGRKSRPLDRCGSAGADPTDEQ